MIAALAICFCFIKEVKTVVFPLPKKPVKTDIPIFFGNEDMIY